MVIELSAGKLKKICDKENLGCVSTTEVESLEAIIGQERALRALNFGLGIKNKGFNIFVAGAPGTGRTTAVKKFLEKEASDKLPSPDWCYVNNFRDNFHPKALGLPAGKARSFQAEMKKMIEQVVQEIRRSFESEEYADNRSLTLSVFQKNKEEILKKISKSAYEQGFAIQASPMGVMTIPLKNGKPLSEEEFVGLDPQTKQEISAKQKELQGELETAFRQSREQDKMALEAVLKLDREVARYAVRHLIEDVKGKFADLSEVQLFLDEVQEDILEHHSELRKEENVKETEFPNKAAGKSFDLRRYEVNVLVDNSELKGAPVILEVNPTYGNLIGQIEFEAQFGALVTDFSLVRGGALLQANGGYLVLPVEDLLRSPFAWEGLKRALANEEVVIEDAGERTNFMTTKSLRPAAIPLNVKVILIGAPQTYNLLRAYDENFGELFKVKADFDIVMERSQENLQDYIAFVSSVCKNEKLHDLDNTALAKFVEHGSRLAGNQEKLSTNFGLLSDVIREANYYALLEGAVLVSSTHIKQAIEEQYYRSNLIQERIREMIENETVLIDVQGEKTGQVNGLSVIGLGDISFGQPNRITASVGMGREGVVNIEREAQLSGPLHTKGVLILSGYLLEQYAQNKPLNLSARVVFEQSYSGVDGDSASSTELYALLSALSGAPIHQGIAVTGSVNQKGEVQAIGGVNEKIEGYFEICKVKGLTGQQGVMIPHSNIPNLMLKDEVIEAVQQGEFHIWPVKTIDEGLEILTGQKAGKRDPAGKFETDSLHDRVNQRLEHFAEQMADYGSLNA